MLKNFIKYPISRKARNEVRKYFEQKRNRIKLVMTLVIKDEEDIIETHIRFHKAMGVDGFIVTSHNSIDNTNKILEKLKAEGIIYEIFHETCTEHKHHIWVEKMVNLAKSKYKANWVINADADEFYFSKSLNLKSDILKYHKLGINSLKVDSNFLFPDDRDDFLSCPYFFKKPFLKYEADILNITNIPAYKAYVGSRGCTKVIHKTKDFTGIADGNHDVYMKDKKEVFPSEIELYHYHAKNYKEYEKKVKRWVDSVSFMAETQMVYMKDLVKQYKEGRLREVYDKQFSENLRSFLMEQGVVVVDKSVSNFISYMNKIKSNDNIKEDINCL